MQLLQYAFFKSESEGHLRLFCCDKPYLNYVEVRLCCGWVLTNIPQPKIGFDTVEINLLYLCAQFD